MSATFLKIDSNTGVSCGYCKILKIAFLYNTSGCCFWQAYHGTVKSAGTPILWFRDSTCFRFWSKLSQNVAQLILYYHVTKQIPPCLNWLITRFWIWFLNMFWKNINCFQFWWKTYTKRCTSNCVISHVKRLSSPTLCDWLGAFSFRAWFGKRKNVI